MVFATGPKVPCTVEVLFFFLIWFFFFEVKNLEVDKEKLEKKNEEIASKFLGVL